MSLWFVALGFYPVRGAILRSAAQGPCRKNTEPNPETIFLRQSLKDFASKAAENAARLAALFHLFSGKTGDISVEHIEQAITLMNWYLEPIRKIGGIARTEPKLDFI